VSKTVVVSGALANKPNNGGEAWVRLSWARGFRQLGYDVFFLEQIDPPMNAPTAVNYFGHVTESFGLAGRAALLDENGAPVAGTGESAVHAAAESAALLVNISGHLRHPELLRRFRRKAYVDIDPGYTQIWHEQKLVDVGGHDVYFTIAANLGSPHCPIPTNGIDWKHVRQPVVLADWPALPAPAGEARFTTVAAWRGSFGTVTHGGNTYGQKAHEFRKVIELPRRAPHRFEVALQIHDGDAKDRAALEANGWTIADPQAVAADPESFRRYVQNSAAEFSVAQGMYVQTNSGWFSDRSTRYLASGRPVLVQATGPLGVPAGEGLVIFRTLDEAAAGADDIVADYSRHAAAARRIAEEYFDSDKVLTRFLADAGVT
jgi:hypothetical protein